MLNRAASLAMLTSALKALPGKLDITKTHLVFASIHVLHTSPIFSCSRTITSVYLQALWKNSLNPDQWVSQKPADLDLNCI